MRNIADHDHTLDETDRRDRVDDLGGETVVLECSDCDYFRAEWRDVPTIGDYGGNDE